MRRLTSPFVETSRGLHGYLRGLAWLRAHPRYLAWLMVPMLTALTLIITSLGTLLSYGETLSSWALFTKPEVWYGVLFYYVCATLLFLGVTVIVLLSAMLLMNVVAAPIYEYVSIAIERDVTGVEPPSLGLRGNLHVVWVELQKTLVILCISIILLLIPGVNILASLLTAFLVGWSFYDFPLARRGWTLRERWRFVLGEFFSVLGFGLWLMIPLAQFVLVPLAIAGGTILNLEALNQQKLKSGG